MNTPLVSIITPSFNQGKYIRQTIESVLAQTYSNIEYIIIDGGSNDETADIVKEYKDKLRFISEPDNGQSDAINKGFRLAKGDIVAWLNSDDVYEPDCVENAVRAFEEDLELGLVYGEGYIIDEHDNRIKVFEATQDFDLWILVNIWDYIMQPTTFFRKSVLEKAGYLDVDLQWCMDWDLWIRLALIAKVRYLPVFMASSREYADTKTSTGGDKRLEEIKKLMRKYSGIETPLGYELYALNTKAEQWKDFPHIQHVYHIALAEMQKTIFENLPQRYADGWIGADYKLIVGSKVKKVEFTFDNIIPANLPQHITISVGGKLVEEIFMPEIECGRKASIELPCTGKLKLVSLHCEKANRASEQDARILGVNIRDIIYKTED